ncbi:MAG TPA: hypothetical protein VIK49_01585 [Steroidobacteraceae bacterium]
MSRDEAPADVQLTRAFIAVALGLVFALALLRPVVDVPSVRTLLPELRAVAGIPCLVIRIFTGDF